jgi:hypothetical protein
VDDVTERRFTATLVARPRGGVAVLLPFSPADAWGERGRYDVHGTIGGHGVRGKVSDTDDGPALLLGPAWCSDPDVGPGNTVEVILAPEGPQLDELPEELRDALASEPEAAAFFETLPTFYRKNYVRPIANAKRPETRERLALRTVEALRDGRRER